MFGIQQAPGRRPFCSVTEFQGGSIVIKLGNREFEGLWLRGFPLIPEAAGIVAAVANHTNGLVEILAIEWSDDMQRSAQRFIDCGLLMTNEPGCIPGIATLSEPDADHGRRIV